MLYEAIKEPLLRILQAPHQPPEPPIGSPESLQIFRAAPPYLTLELLLHFGPMSVALALELVSWAWMPTPGGTAVFVILASLIVGATVVLMLVRYFLIRLDYDMRYYVLTDRSLRIRRGAWTIEESTFTFANVQNLTLHQGPLERLLGITHLQIDTAGGGVQKNAKEGGSSMQHQGRLDGIDPKTAVELRDRILHLVRSYRDAGLGDAPLSRGGRSAQDGERCALLQTIVAELRQIRPAAAPETPKPN